MQDLSLREVIDATGAVTGITDTDSVRITDIVTDSRKAGKGSLYVGIQGESLNGHDFIEDAYHNGAILSMGHQKREDDRYLEVKNSTLALGAIAKHYLSKFDVPKIGVTGSSGKTTTKDMIYFALSGSLYCHRNMENFNNEIGLPLTAFQMNDEHECAIFEMGMWATGEIAYLADIVRPDIAVITNIGTAHIERLGSKENIYLAKMEITKQLAPDGVLIYNGDDSFLASLHEEDSPYRKVRFSMNGNGEYNALSYTSSNQGTRIEAVCKGQELSFVIPTFGKYNVLNAMCALATAGELGLDLNTSALALSEYQGSKLRMDVQEKDGVLLINDSYNANPESMMSTLDMLNDFKDKRKIAVLGDMKELGSESQRLHTELGKMAPSYCDIIIAVGSDAKYLAEGANSAQRKVPVFHVADAETALIQVKKIAKRNDLILVKASRAMALEKVAEGFLS